MGVWEYLDRRLALRNLGWLAGSAIVLCAIPSVASAAARIWVDDLDLRSMKQDLQRPRARLSFDGNVISIGGSKFMRGIGSHANSSLTLDVQGEAVRFQASVGVDDEKKGGPGTVEFQVLGDGKILWRSGVMTTGDAAKQVDLDISGVRTLELKATDAGDGIDSDHADWADACILATDSLTRLYASPPVSTEIWNQMTQRQKDHGYRMDQVAPGVWRIRFGVPEAFTPLTFRSAPIRTEGLAQLPAADRVPIRPADIRIRSQSRGCAIELPMTNEERIYGFGLNIKLFDMTDRRVFIRTSDGPESDLNDSHAPVPFYLSTAGYGVYVDTARFASFYTGNVALADNESQLSSSDHPIATSTEELYQARMLNTKTMVVDVPAAKGVDVYLFAGPTMKDAVCRYNLFSGGGCLPPLWGLGIVYRGAGSFSADDTVKLAKSFRDDHIPCDVWGLEPGWQSHSYSCSFTWDKERFPQPDSFIRQMTGMGYHLSLWEHAFTHPSSPIYKDLLPHSGSYTVWGGLVPDFASAEARRIFGDYHEQTLVKKGIDTFKMDECDNQPQSPQPWSWPEVSTFPSGIDGEQMHALLPLLYQQTLWSALRKDDRRTYGLVRASHALASPLPFVIYSDAYDHREYVRAVAKSGFGGLLWTPEVRDAGTVEELYRRVESAVFSAQALVNAWYMKNPPWRQIDRDKSNRNELMPDQDQVTAGIRQLLELRMSLVPYLYSAFAEYHDSGIPPFRALVLDYPDDPNTRSVDNQFLVGPSLLVAPLFAGERKRSVYLPEGDWYDFRTHQKIAGRQRIEVAAEIGQIPVFVKSGSMIPVAKPVEHIDPDTCFSLTVQVFGKQRAPFVLYEDDGLTYDYEKGIRNRLTLRWDGRQGTVDRTGTYRGAKRYTVEGWAAVD